LRCRPPRLSCPCWAPGEASEGLYVCEGRRVFMTIDYWVPAESWFGSKANSLHCDCAARTQWRQM
jgi:hypothetical protein